MREENPFDQTKINKAGQFLNHLKKALDSFSFFNCSIEIQGDIGYLLTQSGIDGINKLNNDEQTTESIGWITPGLFISNVRFTKPVDFSQCIFRGPVYFHNVFFDAGCGFFQNEFYGDVQFVKVEILMNETI